MWGLQKLRNNITFRRLNYKSVHNGPEQIYAKLAYRDRMALRPETRLQYKCFNIFKDRMFSSKRTAVRNRKI